MHSSTLDSRPLVDRRDREHELWLAMWSAYDNYKEASETLEAVASRGPIAISCQDRIRGIEGLTAKQRSEFDRYIEKRIEYSEFVRDRSNLGAMHFSAQRTAEHSTAPNQRQDERGLWLGGMTSRIAVGAALLCITVVILHEQRRIHDLDVARDETSATLIHSRDDRDSLSRQLSTYSMPKQLASRKVVRATAASLRPHPNSVYRNAEVDRPAVRPQSRITKDTPRPRRTEVASAVVRMYQDPTCSPKSERRSYYRFTLTPSTQFKQVGTVGLSLRKDPKQRYFDLRLMAEKSRVEKKRVKLDVPIWINAAGQLQSVAVVVTRIEKNYVQGYLSEPSHRRSVTTAAQARQRIRRRS
jgi:hypothetical protein